MSLPGTVRPVYPLSPKRAVPDHISRPDYADDGTTDVLCVTAV